MMKVLAFWAKAIIRKYHPKVIGITGSVGKTSTKEVTAFVLAHKFRVRASIKNYNNEFGLPFLLLEWNLREKYLGLDSGFLENKKIIINSG